MSIVITVATTRRIIMKCDGREVDPKTNKIVNEDCIKIGKLCENAIIGCTGHKQACDGLVHFLREPIDSGINRPEILVYIIEKHISVIKQAKIKMAIALGVTYNGKTFLYGWASENGFNINIQNPKNDDDVVYICLTPPDVTEDFSSHYVPTKSLESCMNNYIRKVSTINQSVNDHILTLKLRVD